MKNRYGQEVPDWNPKRPYVPVDRDGNWKSWPGYTDLYWERVIPFKAPLKVTGMTTGKSSKLITLEDFGGKTYPMFVSDLVQGIIDKRFSVHEGCLVGWWTASKRGTNYGIRALSAEEYTDFMTKEGLQ